MNTLVAVPSLPLTARKVFVQSHWDVGRFNWQQMLGYNGVDDGDHRLDLVATKRRQSMGEIGGSTWVNDRGTERCMSGEGSRVARRRGGHLHI